MKVVVVLMLLAIVASMGNALFSMAGNGSPRRTVNALTVRVALSVALFILLFVGWHFGWITPHGG
ncbi:MAG: twin transmembrane helix small protein [Pseudomonadota bacterium]